MSSILLKFFYFFIAHRGGNRERGDIYYSINRGSQEFDLTKGLNLQDFLV